MKLIDDLDGLRQCGHTSPCSADSHNTVVAGYSRPRIRRTPDIRDMGRPIETLERGMMPQGEGHKGNTALEEQNVPLAQGLAVLEGGALLRKSALDSWI